MRQKPSRWNVSPAFVAPEARRLWLGTAFAAPLFRGVGKGVLLGSGARPINLSPTANGAVWKGSPYGVVLGNSNNSEQRRLLFTGYAPIVTSDGAGTGDYTIMVLSNPTAGATGAIQVATIQRLDTGAANQTGLWADANSGGTYASGSFAFISHSTSSSSIAAAGLTDGRWHLYAGVRRAGVMELWRDGVLVVSSALTVRNVYSASANFCIGGIPHVSNLGLHANADVGLGWGWNRALSNAEMRMLARDPFCMFRPRAEWARMWRAPGGGTLTPSDITDAIGFETPGLSQAHVLGAADAFLGQSFETPSLAVSGVLNPTKAVLATVFETPATMQAHVMMSQKLNMGFAYDAASLSTGGYLAPGSRTISINTNARANNPILAGRGLPVTADSRIKSITE